MANSEIISGVDSWVLYGVESTYGSAVAASSIFGGLIQSSSFSVDRQNTEVAGFAGTGTGAGRVTSKFVPGTVATRASIEFKAQQWDWLQYLLLGTRTGSGTGGDPYIYPIGVDTKSLTITEEINNVTTDSQRTYAGMVLNSASIRASVGEAVNVSLDLIGGKIATDTSIVGAQANLSADVYNFAGGTIEMPDATPLGNVIDSVEISIANNYEILYGFNYEAVAARAKKLNLSIKFTLKYLDDDQWTRLLGSATAITSQTPVTLAVKFTSGTRYIDFVFTNVIISKIDDSHNLNEFMVEDVETLAMGLSITEVQ